MADGSIAQRSRRCGRQTRDAQIAKGYGFSDIDARKPFTAKYDSGAAGSI
jgi:hypothetical protein